MSYLIWSGATNRNENYELVLSLLDWFSLKCIMIHRPKGEGNKSFDFTLSVITISDLLSH